MGFGRGNGLKGFLKTMGCFHSTYHIVNLCACYANYMID